MQFRKSPVFLQVLGALLSELEVFITALKQVMEYRTCSKAVGENLDVLGRIVGQFRELINYSNITWFTPDAEYAVLNQAPIWVTNAPLANSYVADDFWFRQLIEGKIARNFVQYGSVPEIQDMVKRALGIDISIVNVPGNPLTVLIIVPDNTSLNNLLLLQRVGNNATVDSVFFLPLPAGVQIAQVIY